MSQRRQPDMNKSEVIKAMAKKCNLSQRECQIALNAFMATVEEAILTDRSISLNNFGVFECKVLPERERLNPQTQERFIAPPKRKVHFKVSPVLKRSVNRDMPKENKSKNSS